MILKIYMYGEAYSVEINKWKCIPLKYIVIINIYLLIEIIKGKTSFISNVCMYVCIYYLAKSNIITTFETTFW